MLAPFAHLFPGELVRFENRKDSPFSEIIAVFQAAAHVLCSHGAGLSNVLFCRPGTRVFEIRRPGTQSEFSELAPSLGLRLHSYIDSTLHKHSRDLASRVYTVNATAWRSFLHDVPPSPPCRRRAIRGPTRHRWRSRQPRPASLHQQRAQLARGPSKLAKPATRAEATSRSKARQ